MCRYFFFRDFLTRDNGSPKTYLCSDFENNVVKSYRARALAYRIILLFYMKYVIYARAYIIIII